MSKMNDLSQKNTTMNTSFYVLVAAIGLLAGIVGSAIVYAYMFDRYMQENVQQNQTVIKEVTQLQDETIVDVVDATTKSVVSIVVTKEVPQYRRMYSPFDLFFGVPQSPQNTTPEEELYETQKIGGGTGFFVSDDGMIVTNRHVVSDPNADYTVVTYDGTEYPAEVLARDSVLDFAVLTVDGSGFSAANLGNSDKLKIGQTVIAIGNSLGEFSHSVSRGIISGMSRDIVAGAGFGNSEELTGIIQTDAAINFGNSGGPLIDLDGAVIGINTAVAQGAENIGFAIPINQVMRLIDDVKKDGMISRPFIGVRYVALTPQIAQEINVNYDHGVLVIRGETITDFAVLPGSPADKAGIVENDIILEIDGSKITNQNSLVRMITEYNVGDTVSFKIWHKGEEKTVDVVLEDRNAFDREDQ
jgi:serine protease Do